MTESNAQRNLFVVSAPSGAGKTSLVNALISAMDDMAVSVSHTTRRRRPEEVDGKNYYFVDRATFEDMRANGEFIESATVFDHLYGTSRAEIERITRAGKHVILEIDWQGAAQIRQTMPSARTIFILPPSTESLQRRLRKRGQDDEATITRRMADAISEMSHYHEFDYIVVNDDFEQALSDMISIIRNKGQHLTLSKRMEDLAPLIADLLP